MVYRPIRRVTQFPSRLSTLVIVVLCGTSPVAAGVTYSLSFSSEVHPAPFTGRVYLFFSPPPTEPRTHVNWFSTSPILAIDVSDWRPESPLTLTTDEEGLLTFPRQPDWNRFEDFHVQALARFNPLDREVTTGDGNGYSPPARVPAGDGSVTLNINQLIVRPDFQETEWTKRLSVRSDLLSQFHGRDVMLEAAVTLPASYEIHPDRRYPTIFEIPGFGGTYRHGRRTEAVSESNARGVEYLRVMLDPECPLGHHVFADSANNGPVGTALVNELLPAFDRQFRSIADPGARFLTGHSSGGWSSLWLQLTWPDVFGGVWSTAPDPVDFRDFQRINLYRPGENMYVDPTGSRRPLARRGEETALWYDDFAWKEHVLGPGGQLHSFEAVFSPRDANGVPRPLWNRMTGEIDTEVAHAWEQYDIRIQIERNWSRLAPMLAGKLHVFMGDQDTFLLEGATILLKQSLADLGCDAVVEIHPGRNHSSLMTRQLRERIRSEMTASFLSHFPDWPSLIR